MTIHKKYTQILPPEDRYCIPGLNEIRFIGQRQTLCLVLGSCVSTVFIGKNDSYILAANHIVIAEPRKDSIVATKSATEQIDEILDIYQSAYNIGRDSILCIHLVGAGSKLETKEFTVPKINVEKTMEALTKKNITPVFSDTGSNFFTTFSLDNGQLSVFVENRSRQRHKSFILDLDELFKLDPEEHPFLPASALNTSDEGFEFLVENKICIFITGKKSIAHK